MDLYKQYAFLKAQKEKIEAEIEEVNAKVVADMKSRKVIKEENLYGKFTIASKKNYTYSNKVKKLEENVKLLKNIEQEKGIAKITETNYLLFKPQNE